MRFPSEPWGAAGKIAFSFHRYSLLYGLSYRGMAVSNQSTDGVSFRCVLMGEESLLIQCAHHLLERGHRIEGVVSDDAQIASWCASHDISHFDPDDYADAVLDLTYDYFFSVANLRIVPKAVMAHANEAAINFHDGPLPEYAGLNTPAWAIINQESVHGVTWHLMTEGIDEGGILVRHDVPIDADETALTLNTKCFEAGASTFKTLVRRLEEGGLSPQPQDTSRRTYFARHEPLPNDGVIDWSWTAERIDALVRGTSFGTYRNPLGTAKCIIEDALYRVGAVDVRAETSSAAPGTVVEVQDDAIVLSTGSTTVAVTALQSLTGEALPIEDVVARHHIEAGLQWGPLSEEDARSLGEHAATLSQCEAFWVRALQRVQPVDLPYPARRSTSQVEISTQEVALPPEAKPLVEDEDGAWWGDDLLVAAVVYLMRLTRQETLSIGVPVEGAERSVPGASSVVPFTASVDRERSLSEAMDALRNGLERIRQKKTYRRDVFARYPALRKAEPAGPPSFEVMASVTAPGHAVPAAGEHELPEGTRLHLMIDPERQACHWVYDAGSIDPRFISDMEDHLQHVIHQVGSDAGRPFRAVSVLSPSARERLLVDWNDTDAPYAQQSIHAFVEAQVERTPDAPAVAFKEEEATYEELDKQANRLAHYLRRHGVQPGSLVGICTERSVQMVVGLLGILKAGAAYVPLDPSYPADRLASWSTMRAWRSS